MPASSKASRQPPVANIEDYTLFYVVEEDVGLTHFADTQMMPVPKMVGEFEDIGKGGTNDAWGQMEIGFDFPFDQQTYANIHINTHGWATIDETSELELFGWQQTNFVDGGEWQNEFIRMNMTTDHVMLAPWFDDSKNVYDNPTSAGMSSTEVFNLLYGRWRPREIYRPVQAGVKYMRDNNSPLGRRLIIRWTSLTNYSSPLASSIIRFELVLYENGRIEFRYTPRNSLRLQEGISPTEDATIGIFGNILSKNRFRDFSRELGIYVKRERYYKGGSIYNASWTDAAGDGAPTPYVKSLRPWEHWPGQRGKGAMFVFQPPTKRRKILPRLFVRGFDSLSRYPKFLRTGGASRSQFDDRRSLNITSGALQIVNYPTKLPRNFGGNKQEAQTRRDIYEGGFETSGSTQGAFDVFKFGASVENFTPIAPFSEANNHSIVFNQAEYAFFATGSNPDDLNGFDQPIWSKTQLKLEFPIEYTTRMLETTSSILYYDAKFKQFYQKGVSYAFDENGEVDSITALDNRFARNDSNRHAVPEDYRGFGPIGNVIVSGSANGTLASGGLLAAAGQTDSNINDMFSGRSYTDAIQTEYGKSICINADYDASQLETFTLPIVQPFLIEKAIIELPIEAGPKWFEDKTRVFQPIGALTTQYGSYVDMGGPAVTVALFNQLRFGEERRRDLILSATFTHTGDSGSNVIFEDSTFSPNTAQMYIEGFDGIGGCAAAYVEPNTSGTMFTGSVRMLTTAMISNGIYATLRRDANLTISSENRALVRDFIAQPEIKIKNSVTSNGTTQSGSIFRNSWVNNFGRSQTGFESSGQSIFGREHETKKNVNKIENKFFFGTSPPAAIENIISTNDNFILTHPISLLKYRNSPYLVFPGQQIVLAISKTRPRVYTTADVSLDENYFYNEDWHDIKIPSGSSVKITLFGSHVQNSKEFHDTLSQPLDSDGIHEIIKDNPVLDQFEVVDRRIFSGTFDDSFVTGSLLELKPKYARTSETDVFTQNNKEVAFSVTQASHDNGFIQDGYKSIRLTKQYEVAGLLRNVRHVSDDETFWDSLVPDPRACAAKNGAALGIGEGYEYAGAMWLWDVNKFWNDVTDKRWSWSYPFEPHYAGIQRLDNIIAAYAVRYLIKFSPTELETLDSIVPVAGITVWAGGVWYRSSWSVFGRWFSDQYSDVFSFSNIRPLSDDDALMVMYGFGDYNSYTGAANEIINGYVRPDIEYDGSPPNTATDVAGTTHSPFPRVPHSPGTGYTFCLHPEIRGWKYGLLSGIPTNSSCVFRRNKYGQFRDMLEQRPFAAYYGSLQGINQSAGINENTRRRFKRLRRRFGTKTKLPRPGPVYIRFINPITGRLTSPDNTWSSNLSYAATSSMPYIDGIATNRPDINVNALNQAITTFSTDENNNLTI